MPTHQLKTDPIPFTDLWEGRKTAEVRRDDRGYQENDGLILRETSPSAATAAILNVEQKYTGRRISATVTHVQRGYGLPDGLCVLSLHIHTKTTGGPTE